MNDGTENHEASLESATADQCIRCLTALTPTDIKLASEDRVQYCAVCRARLEAIRTAIRQAGGGFHTGL